MVEDVEGIGFARADELGNQLGIRGNHPDRIKAGCLYTLENESIQNGHVYLEQRIYVEKVKQLLEEKTDEIEFTRYLCMRLSNLIEENKLIVEEE